MESFVGIRAFVPVRMYFHGQLAKGSLDAGMVRAGFKAQYAIIAFWVAEPVSCHYTDTLGLYWTALLQFGCFALRGTGHCGVIIVIWPHIRGVQKKT